jgi:hypothetical protein
MANLSAAHDAGSDLAHAFSFHTNAKYYFVQSSVEFSMQGGVALREKNRCNNEIMFEIFINLYGIRTTL